MIDALPTILDLAGLAVSEVLQGQSLAPLLRGEPGWEPRPVIVDEFVFLSDAGVFHGQIEVINGRWGTTFEINRDLAPYLEWSPGQRRPAPLLRYDLWNDPQALHSLHEARPDLVEEYTAFLEAQWETHQALAQHFTRSEASPLTPEQLRTLRRVVAGRVRFDRCLEIRHRLRDRRRHVEVQSPRHVRRVRTRFSVLTEVIEWLSGLRKSRLNEESRRRMAAK